MGARRYSFGTGVREAVYLQVGDIDPLGESQKQILNCSM